MSALVPATPNKIDRLINYLQENNTVNPMEGWKHLGIYRLAARVHELRSKGMNILTTRVKVLNQFGEECSVAQYELVSSDEK